MQGEIDLPQIGWISKCGVVHSGDAVFNAVARRAGEKSVLALGATLSRDGKLLVCRTLRDGQTVISALRLADGELQWESATWENAWVVGEGLGVFWIRAATGPELYALSAATGDEVNCIDPPVDEPDEDRVYGAFGVAPAHCGPWAGHVVYAGAATVMQHAPDGTMLWRRPLGDSADDDDIIFTRCGAYCVVTCTRGKRYFRLSDGEAAGMVDGSDGKALLVSYTPQHELYADCDSSDLNLVVLSPKSGRAMRIGSNYRLKTVDIQAIPATDMERSTEAIIVDGRGVMLVNVAAVTLLRKIKLPDIAAAWYAPIWLCAQHEFEAAIVAVVAVHKQRQAGANLVQAVLASVATRCE